MIVLVLFLVSFFLLTLTYLSYEFMKDDSSAFLEEIYRMRRKKQVTNVNVDAAVAGSVSITTPNPVDDESSKHIFTVVNHDDSNMIDSVKAKVKEVLNITDDDTLNLESVNRETTYQSIEIIDTFHDAENP